MTSTGYLDNITLQYNNPEEYHTAQFKPIMEHTVRLTGRKYEVIEEGDDIHVVMYPEAGISNCKTRLIVAKQMVRALKEVLENV